MNVEGFRRACALLPARLRTLVADSPLGGETEELRLRAGQPLFLAGPWGERAAGGEVSPGDLEAVLDAATGHSLYTASETMRQGFFTAQGGLRIGVCGLVSAGREGVEAFRSFSSLSIRIPRQRRGVGTELAEEWLAEGLPSLLLAGPPGEGKTTLLRDVVRQISGRGVRVGLADERGEVAAVFRGRPQLDVGPHTDILEGCPKALALPMLLRAMAPRVIAVDEVAVAEDVAAMALAANSGVSLLATVHAASLEELGRKRLFQQMRELFPKVLLLRREQGRYRLERL